jgi:hypothetical protein
MKTNNEIVGRVAEDLPQYFQLRRPQKWLAGRETVGSAEVLEGGQETVPLHLPPL